MHGSLDALPAATAVDAIYIATPHSGHSEATAAALRAGKRVLCEKPLAATVAQAERRLLEGHTGRVLAVQSSFGLHCPYEPLHRSFRSANDAGHRCTGTHRHRAALRGQMQMQYGNGVTSQFACAFDVALEPAQPLAVQRQIEALRRQLGAVRFHPE